MTSISKIAVCRIAKDYPVGGDPSYGLQPVYYYLSKEQAKLGHDVHVVTNRKTGQPKSENYGRVTIHRVDSPFDLNAYQIARSVIYGHRDTILHTHATAGFFTVPMKGALGVPVVSHVHGTTRSHHMPVRLLFGDVVHDYSPIKVTYYFLREKILWSCADRVLTVSSVIKTDLSEHYRISQKKIRVVFNGVDEQIFKPQPDETFPEALKKFEGKKIILYVGHFGLRKGVVYLIRAMNKISKECPDAVLVCVGGVPSWLGGTDYWSYLQKEIERDDLVDRVLLLDRVPNVQLPAFYSAASVFVLPSYYEAFGKVVVEAMACGTPVVATKRGGLSEVVDDGKSGFLIDYGSADAIANAVLAILSNEALASKMGEFGRHRVERDFTWNSVATRIDSVYSELLD